MYGEGVGTNQVLEVTHEVNSRASRNETLERHRLMNVCHLELQMHYVHINTKYSDFHEAAQNKDGLAVFGTLFQVR